MVAEKAHRVCQSALADVRSLRETWRWVASK